MESSKLRAVLLLKMHLLWIFGMSLQTHSAPNPEDVIDLLAALNLSQHRGGVSRLQTSSSIMYKIRPRAAHLILPQEYSHHLHSSFQGNLGVHLVGRQALRSGATILSLSSTSSPILQMISSTLDNTLQISLSGGRAPVSFLFPKTNPLSGGIWVRLAVSLEPDRLVFFVECQDAVVLPIKCENRVNWEVPPDVVIALGSIPENNDSKFNGYLKTAEISLKAYVRRPWSCDNITDDLPGLHHDMQVPNVPTDTSQSVHPDASLSERQTNPRPQEQSSRHPQDVQNDQQQRGAVLGPPGSPQGVRSVSQTQADDTVDKLERRLEELSHMLDMVKAQNADLQSRVTYLEGCECVRQGCVWDGHKVEEGRRWQLDPNTVCSCTSGEVTCQTNSRGCDQDGWVHNVSYVTLDGCQTCACKEDGNRECSPQPCPPSDCPPREPGDCRACTHSGVRYDHGARWRPAESLCDVCSCLEGRVHCEREECSPPCENPSAPPPGSSIQRARRYFANSTNTIAVCCITLENLDGNGKI